MIEDQQPDDRQTTFTPPTAPPDDDRATAFAAAATSDDRATVVHTRPAPAAAGFVPGATVLRGQYVLEERLRGGAQAMAFRGTRIIDRAPVFVKIQPNPTGRSDAFAKQIWLRDKLLAVRHPNLLRCHDLDLETDALCEVYEWLEGRELTALFTDPKEQFGDDRLRRLITQLAEAIHELHTATSLSHRDLKPDNIRVVTRQGAEHFVIVDYGTVSQLDSGGATTVAGTRVYSPPEFYQRRIPNDPLLGTWDWWSLGRIVQEAIDRIHPYDRLSRLFANDLKRGKQGVDARVAVELMFDTIMLENERSHYNMRAGMVELTEAGGRLPHWLPLLRGLLTSRRRGRWGYEEVQRFLRGEKVPDSYSASLDGEGFVFEGQTMSLPELAQKLTAESAPDTEAGAARWAQAVELLYRGKLARYVSKVLQDSDLTRELQQCQAVDDRDLGTALAIAAISEGTVPPAVRGVEINARFLFQQATTLPDTVPPPARVATLLSADFQSRLKRFHPPNAAELEQESSRLDGFGYACRQMGVKTKQFGMGTVLRVLHATDDEVKAIIAQARTKLSQSDIESLQQAFAEPSLDKLNTFEQRALVLALTEPAKHGFMTHEDHASSLRSSAERCRKAYALQSAAFYLHPYFSIFNGKFFKLAIVASCIAFVWILGSATASVAGLPSRYFVPRFSWIAIAALTWGLLYGSLRYLWAFQIERFARQFMDTKGLHLTASLLKTVASRSTGLNGKKEFERLNKEIRALPYIDHAKFVVPTPNLGPIRIALWIQLALIAVLLIGGKQYAPQMIERKTPNIVIPSYSPGTLRQLPGKAAPKKPLPAQPR